MLQRVLCKSSHPVFPKKPPRHCRGCKERFEYGKENPPETAQLEQTAASRGLCGRRTVCRLLLSLPSPEVPAETTRPDEAEEVSAEDTAQDAEALAQAAHLERKPYFYTILVSGVDDHNGGSDTNILVAVDAENDYIYGVSIPGTPRPSSMERTTRSTSPITPAGPLCWPRPSPSSWASQWILR